MDARSSHRAPRSSLLGGVLRLLGWLIGLASAGAAVTALLVANGVLGVDRLDEEIRSRVEEILAGHYADLEVTVASAERIGSRGVEVRGLVIRDPQATGSTGELARLDRMLIECDSRLGTLLSGNPEIRHLTLHGLRMRAAREADGSWSAEKLFPPPQLSDRPPSVSIEEGEIMFDDGGEPLVLRDVQVGVAPDFSQETQAAFRPAAENEAAEAAPSSASAAPLKVTGRAGCRHFQGLRLTSWFDVDSGRWIVEGSVRALLLGEPLRRALPPELAEAAAALQGLQGKADLRFQFDFRNTSDQSEGGLRFLVKGKVSEGRFEDPRLPLALTDLSASLECDNRGVRITEAAARAGDATLRLSAASHGYTDAAAKTVNLQLRNLELTPPLAEALPGKLRKVWDKYSPRGLVHLDGNFTFDGHKWRPVEATVQAVDLSLAYERFPYRVTGGKGWLALKEDRLSIDLRLLADQTPILCAGEIEQPGPEATGWVEVRSEGDVPLDDKLVASLGGFGKVQDVIRSLRPRGRLSFQSRFERTEPRDDALRKDLTIQISEGAIRYDKFPYPLEAIRGTLVMENDHWSFRDFEGRNDSGYVTCNGGWTPHDGEGGKLTLNFVGSDIALEDELRAALTPGAQRMWSSLRPRGAIDHLEIKLAYDSQMRDLSLRVDAQKWPAEQNVRGRSVSVEPVWLPYRMETVTGEVTFENGRVELRDIKGAHGRTEVALSGTCQTTGEGAWTVNLTRLTADRLQADRELVAALPPALGGAIGRLNLSGPINMSGNLNLAKAGSEAPVDFQWDLQFDLENGSLHCGLPLEHLHGGVRLVGGGNQHGFQSRGELNFDSLMYRDIQFTQVRGPLWFNQSRVLFGAIAAQGQTEGPPRQLTANVFGGSINADSALTFGEPASFDVQASLVDGDLAELTRAFGSNQQSLTGRTHASLKLSGTTQGPHTWRGSGGVRLRDADVYQLPVMLSLLKLLTITPPDATAFTTAEADFRVVGEHIYFTRIDFNGDAVSLRGNGDMNLDRQINLQFYTLVGREERSLAPLRQMLGEAGRQLLLIQVTGTLDQPQTESKTLPGLEQALQQIFPEGQPNGAPLADPRQIFGRGRFPAGQ